MAELNLRFYNGMDAYSDGVIEDEFLAIVEQCKDIHSLLSGDSRWPILYHFSPERRNLLAWYPFNRESALLEVGAGCGALTGLFCEKVAHVSAVELSKKRSQIVCKRYSHCDNLEVFAGNIVDIKFPHLFDYITLIGVLEYTKSFIKTSNPYTHLLGKLATCLKPGGKLFVAIENKFGIKYFAGAKEDHTGYSFDGIEGYLNTNKAETFSKEELSGFLRQAGFSHLQFYYPYPDYKLPAEIFSDSYQPDINHIVQDAPNFDHDRLKIFSERLSLINIIRNKKFDFFSNSYLVIAQLNTPCNTG